MGPIGIFDSGYGGLTILCEFMKKLPQHDFIYLGDNARAPYGNRSFDTVYRYTLEAVEFMFALDCPLVILACNTASSKALRTIQQVDLPRIAPNRRVLGVIRPTIELLHTLSRTNHVGIMGTTGTVASGSYLKELEKINSLVLVTQEACPMWVPLVENRELDNPGTDYFVQKNIDSLLAKDPEIDVILLACTHYPVLLNTIKKFVPPGITVLPQDSIVAESLADYLNRHEEINIRCGKNSAVTYYTSDSPEMFNTSCKTIFGLDIESKKVTF